VGHSPRGGMGDTTSAVSVQLTRPTATSATSGRPAKGRRRARIALAISTAAASSGHGAIGPVASRRKGDAEDTPAPIVRNVECAVAPAEHVDRATPYSIARTPTRREVLDSRPRVGG